MEEKLKLNIGSGNNQSIEAAVTIDFNAGTNPDVVHDLNQFPWPFPDNRFTEIHCMDVLEHLDDIVRVMNEIHRIAAPQANVFITSPHFSSRNAFTDPTHKHFFGLHSFDYFTVNGHADFSKWNYYSGVRFSLEQSRLQFDHNLINKVIRRIAARYPDFWESRLAWIFPAWFMSVHLRAIK